PCPMRCEEGPDPYQLRLGELGRIDVLRLGMGPDGHTASLFHGSPALEADPGRLVVMNEDPSGRNPFPRMTLTFAGIARARLVLVTVAGEHKRDALARVAAGDPELPASHIRADRVLWLVDPAAAGDRACAPGGGAAPVRTGPSRRQASLRDSAERVRRSIRHRLLFANVAGAGAVMTFLQLASGRDLAPGLPLWGRVLGP